MRTMLAAVIVVVILVAGVSAYALVKSRAPASPGAPQTGASAEYPVCSTQINSAVDQGYEINTFLTTASPKLGQTLCVNVLLLNIDGRNVTQSTDTGVNISYNITDSSGAVVFTKSCPAVPESLLVNSTGTPNTIVSSFTCEGFWDTSAAYQGTVPQAGKYYIDIQASIPYQFLSGLAVADTEVGFTLSA